MTLPFFILYVSCTLSPSLPLSLSERLICCAHRVTFTLYHTRAHCTQYLYTRAHCSWVCERERERDEEIFQICPSSSRTIEWYISYPPLSMALFCHFSLSHCLVLDRFYYSRLLFLLHHVHHSFTCILSLSLGLACSVLEYRCKQWRVTQATNKWLSRVKELHRFIAIAKWNSEWVSSPLSVLRVSIFSLPLSVPLSVVSVSVKKQKLQCSRDTAHCLKGSFVEGGVLPSALTSTLLVLAFLLTVIQLSSPVTVSLSFF